MNYQNLTFVGYTGKAPELRYSQDGKAIASFSVGVTDGNDETVWFNVTAWGATAEAVAKFVGKGSRVMVVGRVKLRTYEKKSGGAGASMDVSASTVLFLDRVQSVESAANEYAEPLTIDDIPF